MLKFSYYLILIVVLSVPVVVMGAEKSQQPTFEDENIRLRVFPRTADQMTGFYSARGFPERMTQLLSDYCFMTIIIKNKLSDVLWLELNEWQFMTADGPLKRYQRNHWLPLWKAMAIPMAAQSTFRWTLMPENLDFYPDEAEGGNVILSRTDQPFSLIAHFAVGKNKKGKMIKVKIDNLRCATNESNV